MGSVTQPIFYIERAVPPESQNYRCVALLDFTPTADLGTRETVSRFLEKSNKVTLRESPNNGGGNGKWFTILVGAGLVIGGAVGLYFAYKTSQTVEREIVGAIRGWKDAGFPALVNIKIEKVCDKFTLH